MGPTGSPPNKFRIVPGTIVIMIALLFLAGGWIIPFKFESFSILYKFGLDKIYLRSGKVIGITVTLLVFYEVLLASRFMVLEEIFFLKRLIKLHRINGIIITILAALHPLLIKSSEHFTSYTFAKKYYPEFIGIALLSVLLIHSFIAVFRNLIKLSYKKWLLWHRLGASLILLLIPAHILYVSQTFTTGIPRQGALIIFCLNLVMILRIWLLRLIKFAP
jgi:predicted ferric reductase